LITNDPEAALRFYSECEGKVVFKSISGVRSIVRLMDKEDLGRLALLENCPTQFQEYVAGDNIRVHVIGERLFAVRIQVNVCLLSGSSVMLSTIGMPDRKALPARWFQRNFLGP
jgi:hypothetical protein